MKEQRVTVIKGLYAVSPEAEDSEQLLAKVSRVLDNGVAILQYRNKSDNTVRRLRQASLLASLCKSRQVLFLINDDVTLARAVEADGVHLGKTDGSVADARAVLGPDAIIGGLLQRHPPGRAGCATVPAMWLWCGIPLAHQAQCRGRAAVAVCRSKKTGPAVGRHWRHQSGQCRRGSRGRCQRHCGDWWLV
jgi:thiamine-phosphate pyrophosphorylase